MLEPSRGAAIFVLSQAALKINLYFKLIQAGTMQDRTLQKEPSQQNLGKTGQKLTNLLQKFFLNKLNLTNLNSDLLLVENFRCANI